MSRSIAVTIPVPDWANWMAQDKDGRWWVYENKPIACSELDGWKVKSGFYKMLYSDTPTEDWKKEAYEITDDEFCNGGGL